MVRDVVGAGQEHRPHGSPHARGDRRDLRGRGVLVRLALEHEERTADEREPVLDVPGAEARVEPGVGPGAEHRFGPRAVEGGELFTQATAFEGGEGGADPADRLVLDEDVGGDRDHGGDPFGKGRGEEERDRAAVAVAHEDRPADAGGIEHGRQLLARRAVEIVERAGERLGVGAAVAAAIVEEDRKAVAGREELRQVLPEAGRAETLVEEGEDGFGGSAGRPDPLGVDRHARRVEADRAPGDGRVAGRELCHVASFV